MAPDYPLTFINQFCRPPLHLPDFPERAGQPAATSWPVGGAGNRSDVLSLLGSGPARTRAARPRRRLSRQKRSEARWKRRKSPAGPTLPARPGHPAAAAPAALPAPAPAPAPGRPRAAMRAGCFCGPRGAPPHPRFEGFMRAYQRCWCVMLCHVSIRSEVNHECF
jgi:hypothetical protein